MSSRLGARMSEWEGEEKEKQPLNQLDAFVDDAAVEAPVVKTGNCIHDAQYLRTYICAYT
jgi:hypothetical protein